LRSGRRDHDVDRRIDDPCLELSDDLVLLVADDAARGNMVAGAWLLANRAYFIRGDLLTAMIRCRYQELDLTECHAVAKAVGHCAAASAHCR
jgi:hypothetical protein